MGEPGLKFNLAGIDKKIMDEPGLKFDLACIDNKYVVKEKNYAGNVGHITDRVDQREYSFFKIVSPILSTAVHASYLCILRTSYHIYDRLAKARSLYLLPG